MDSGGHVESVPTEFRTEPPSLSEMEQITLKSWAEYVRQAPSEFASPHQVFSRPDPSRLQYLAQLQAKGYLEPSASPGQGYRLTKSGWAALGLRLVKLDLRNF